MKRKVKNVGSTLLLLGSLLFLLPGCYESHYYNHYHHHTRGWYDHHHTPPPPGVDFNVDIESRH